MDKKRKSTAAARRRKKRTQQNITSAAIAVAACALVVFGCTEFLNMHMNNSDNTVVYQAVLPTVLPQGTLMPVDPAYANATAAPSSESTSTTADELNSGDGWMLMLVNAENAVPDGYEPTAFTELSNGQKVDKRIYPSLQSMFDDMREQGVYPYVESGYRTSDEQQALMEEKIAEYVYLVSLLAITEELANRNLQELAEKVEAGSLNSGQNMYTGTQIEGLVSSYVLLALRIHVLLNLQQCLLKLRNLGALNKRNNLLKGLGDLGAARNLTYTGSACIIMQNNDVSCKVAGMCA